MSLDDCNGSGDFPHKRFAVVARTFDELFAAGRAASRTPATVPESMGTSGARRSGIFLGDEVALLAVLLDHREARFFLEHALVSVLVTGGHHESLRVRPHCFVFLTREPDGRSEAFVFALAEIRRPLLA